MTLQVKIAHISDLHLSGRRNMMLLDHLDRLFGFFKDSGFDHLVITGDLSDRANPEDWALTRELLERHGLLRWERTTVVAGNHDVINLEEEMRFYNALNPFQFFRSESCRRRLDRFYELFQELVTGSDGDKAGTPFVKILRFGKLQVALAAFNSVWPWSPVENPLGARGLVAAEELHAAGSDEVVRLLREALVIGLCHHAWRVYDTDSLIDQAFDWTMELQHRDAFLELMQRLGAKLVLHGHFHRFQTYQAGGIRFVNGGYFRNAPLRYSELVIDETHRISQRFAYAPL